MVGSNRSRELFVHPGQSTIRRGQVSKPRAKGTGPASSKLGGSGGTLDYVTAWFILAGEYLGLSAARVGFVATNSITQGEQSAYLVMTRLRVIRLRANMLHSHPIFSTQAT